MGIIYNHNETVLAEPGRLFNHNETVLREAAATPGIRLSNHTETVLRRAALALAVPALAGALLGFSTSPGVIPTSDGFGSSPRPQAGVITSPGPVVLAYGSTRLDQEMEHG